MIARQWDIVKTEQMLEKELNWRKEFIKPFDPIRFKLLVEQRAIYISDQRDKFDRPVIMSYPARYNPKNRNLEECVKGTTELLERAVELIRCEKNTGFVLLMDLTNL